MHAVTDVLTLVYDNIHEKKYSGLIFLDIQKAFDLVDHNILIAKLEHYGIRGVAKNLFESYLQNRQQFVALDDESRQYTTYWGVPQGSTLGPLFLIYINDFINCTSVTPRLFADDSCLCFSSPKPENLQEIINSDLKIVSEWITANKLRINAQKSSALIISPKSNDKASYQNLTILFDDFKINLSKCVKYLGLQIDDNLTFKTHINFLYSKRSRTLSVMFKVKHYLLKTYLLLLYNTLFHPHLIYCILAWSSTFSTYLNPLQTLQNKAIKLIEGLNHWQSSTTAYKKLKILKINELVKFEIVKFLHQHFNNKLLLNFQNYFVGLNQIHTIDTRRRLTGCNYRIPFYKISRMQRLIKYKGGIIWNNIPSDVRKNTFRKFKSNYKDQLLANY